MRVHLALDSPDILARIAAAGRVGQRLTDLLIAGAAALHGCGEAMAHRMRLVGSQVFVADLRDRVGADGLAPILSAETRPDGGILRRRFKGAVEEAEPVVQERDQFALFDRIDMALATLCPAPADLRRAILLTLRRVDQY